jgi:hypothetical protein
MKTTLYENRSPEIYKTGAIDVLFSQLKLLSKTQQILILYFS